MKHFVAAAVGCLLALGGCIQAEQGTTLFPDGSGKLSVKIGVKKSMLQMMEQFAQANPQGGSANPLDQFSDPAKLQENSEGIVAWAKPEKTEKEEWIYITTAGYFEDINKVKMYNVQPGPGGTQDRKLAFAAKYEKTDAGHVLVFRDESTGDLGQGLPGGGDGAGDNPELAKAIVEQMKPMLEGMKVSVKMTVPGPITEAPAALEREGRTASLSLGAEDIFAVITDPEGERAKKLKSISETSERRIVWKEHTVGSDEIAAFKKEMASAKEQWQKLLDEAKKKKTEE